ncbi:hypothetical protein GGX14DRAFT_348199, partial [Mycena pura]
GLSAYALIHGERERSRGLKKVLNRNKFISRFILDATNQVRTSKQVSSRLQQLRGTTQDERGKRFLKLYGDDTSSIQSWG